MGAGAGPGQSQRTKIERAGVSNMVMVLLDEPFWEELGGISELV